MQTNRFRVIPWITTLFFIVLLTFTWLQRQAIFDWMRLKNYQAPARIAEIASSTTMNNSARRLFYVFHPTLDNRETFSQHCPERGEKTIILGCYVNPRGIYLFDVTDDRLAGVEEVTAAHELLHAAYDRLGHSDREQVNSLLSQSFSTVTSRRIQSAIDSYRKAGDDVSNELHSIIGTEVRDLSPELEKYYARYFTDRKKVVDYSESYERAFTDREALAASYLAEMENIKKQLEETKSDIDTLENRLSSQFSSLEQERGTTNDINSFNTKVGAYNNQVQNYKDKIATYNKLVSDYNSLTEKYNAVALEENELIKALDSRQASVPSQ